MLDSNDLKRAVINAESVLKKIKNKNAIDERYPDVKMYLVFSSPRGQMGVNWSIETMLEGFPAMIVDDAIKLAVTAEFHKLQKLKHAQKNVKILDNGKNDIQTIMQTMESYALKLSYRDDVNIELRFESLRYELIWKLQKDELVDRTLTPQTRASIRVVIGTTGNLSRRTEVKNE